MSEKHLEKTTEKHPAFPAEQEAEEISKMGACKRLDPICW